MGGRGPREISYLIYGGEDFVLVTIIEARESEREKEEKMIEGKDIQVVYRWKTKDYSR